MLSDHDREVLAEIHQGLADDDQFMHDFALGAKRLVSRGPRRSQAMVTGVLIMALLLTALMVAVQAAGPALFFTGVSCWAIWRRGWRSAGRRTRRP